MKRRMTVFDLGRMRHLDLLALWHQLNPDSHDHRGVHAARMTTGQLVAAVLGSPRT